MKVKNTRDEHENEICKAVLDTFDTPFEILGKPDNDIREKKAVDFYGTISNQTFYLEHTLIESYPNQIEDDKQIEFLFSLQTELEGKLPMYGNYHLVLAPNSLKGFKNNENIKNVLRNWILKNAKTLELGSPAIAPHHFLRETPIGLPFEVTLYRFQRGYGKLIIMRDKPETLESKRLKRIKTAIHKKCPKLRESKNSNQDLSLLVLESNDIALANHMLIGDSLVNIFRELEKELIPDEIFLVMTDTNPWNVFQLIDKYFILKNKYNY